MQSAANCSGLEWHCCWRQGSVEPNPGAQVVLGGEEGRGWKDGGRVVINTDRGESVLVCGGITTGPDWHDHTGSVVSSRQKDTEGSALKE